MSVSDGGIGTCRWYNPEVDSQFFDDLAARVGLPMFSNALIVVAEFNGDPFAFGMFKLDDTYEEEPIAFLPVFAFESKVASVNICRLMLATALEYVSFVLDQDYLVDEWVQVEQVETFEISQEFDEGDEEDQFLDDMRSSGRFVQTTEVSHGILVPRSEFMRSIGFVSEIVDGQSVSICR